MLRISTGSSPTLPNQCGTVVSNAATSPGPSTQILVAENETHVPGQEVDPLVAVVRPRFRAIGLPIPTNSNVRR